MDDGQLTVVLTLKDRTAFTLRWLAYASRVRFPFKVLIADGGSDDAVEQALAKPGAFPDVDVEYRRYPFDASYADFYAKTTDALERVTTPLVVMADNDDLFVVDGLRDAVRFLMQHPDYASCGGQCAVFWTNEGIQWKSSLDRQSLPHDQARTRLERQSLRATYPVYYHVQRTSLLREAFDRVRAWNPRDLFLLEQFLCSLSAIQGKTRQLERIYIARQWDSASSAGGAHIEQCGDWLGRMLVPSWSEDFGGYVRLLSVELARRDDMSLEDARACVIRAYRAQVAPALASDLLSASTVTTRMAVTATLAQRLLSRRPESSIRRAARWLYRRTRWVSIDAVQGTQLRTARVSHASADFEPIRRFLLHPPEPAPLE